MYFYTALKNVLTAAFSKDKNQDTNYPSEPFPLTDEEAKEQEARKERENFFSYLKQMEAESERNIKRLEQAKKEAVEDGREHD